MSGLPASDAGGRLPSWTVLPGDSAYPDARDYQRRDAAPVLAHVHVADTFNHRASSGLRCILNPPGTQARVHQHMDICQGETFRSVWSRPSRPGSRSR